MVIPKSKILLLIAVSVLVFPQTIDKKKKELNNIKTEIKALETEYNKKAKTERRTIELVENFNKQNYLLNKLISQYKKEEADKEEEIAKREEEIFGLEREMKFLKSNYSKYIVATYKYGMDNELAFLLTSQTLDQAVTRYRYLRRFSDRRQEDLTKIKNAREELVKVKELLNQEITEKQELADAKQKEELNLTKKLSEKEKLLASIKNDKASLTREIASKRRAESTIKNLISSLIAKDERRKKEAEKEKEEELRQKALIAKAEKKNAKKADARLSLKNNKTSKASAASVNYNYDGLSPFSTLKGKLNWPISGAKVVRNFGENKNSKLNTVTLNYGIDMLARNDVNVKCVAEGIVSTINYVPGYGSVLIVTHKGDYRTVYSHLAVIYVHEGQKIKAGSTIAKVGESLEGNILHFEIWNNRNFQNPQTWLARK